MEVCNVKNMIQEEAICQEMPHKSMDDHRCGLRASRNSRRGNVRTRCHMGPWMDRLVMVPGYGVDGSWLLKASASPKEGSTNINHQNIAFTFYCISW
jgi:hypothetical protein